MPISLLPKLLLYILVVGYSPGPANLYSLSCALKYGRKASLHMWRGLFVGYTIAMFFCVLAVHLVGEVVGNYVNYLKYIGAAYILWLAFNIYKSESQVKGADKACSFLSGMLVQLTNAKMILFELTVYSMFVLPYTNSFLSLFEVGFLLLVAGPGANLVWLLAGTYLEKFFVSYKKQVSIVMSLCLAICAILVVLG